MNDYDPNLNTNRPPNPHESNTEDRTSDSVFDEPVIESTEAPVPPAPFHDGSQKPIPELTLEPDPVPEPIPEPIPEPPLQDNSESDGYKPPSYTGSGDYYQPPQYGYPQQYDQPQYTQPPVNAPPYPGVPYYQQQQYTQYSQTPPPGYQQKSRLAAALLGILYGSLGIHNFYLGYTTRAIIQLVVSIIGLVFSFAFVPLFLYLGMYIWGLVEGIQILIGHNERLYDANNVILKD